jgi:hypothetical protein
LAADAGFAGVGRYGVGSKDDPIEVVMASAKREPDFIGNGRYWARTSDPQLVELVLSQLS